MRPLLLLIGPLRLTETTYTVDEIKDILDDLEQEAGIEVRGKCHESQVTNYLLVSQVDNELISSAHMSVLLLQQVFAQAQHWRLDLEVDLAELENR